MKEDKTGKWAVGQDMWDVWHRMKQAKIIKNHSWLFSCALLFNQIERTSAFSRLLPSCLAFALTKSMLSSLSSALALSTAWDLAILLVSL